MLQKSEKTSDLVASGGHDSDPLMTEQSFFDVATAACRANPEADWRGGYETYIASPAWLQNPARLAELEAAGRRCRLCNRSPPTIRLEVHHRCYRNLGCEQVGDLTALCATCHTTTTAMLKARNSLACHRIRHARRIGLKY